jgi:hypothetical protein
MVVRERDETTRRPGAWVRGARRAAGLTQMDLAFACGVSETSVRRWERTAIDFLAWRGLLSILDLPPDWEPPRPRKPRRR